VAVLCAAAMFGEVHAAPTDVRANQTVNRLAELLRQRQQAGETKVSTIFTLILFRQKIINERTDCQ